MPHDHSVPNRVGQVTMDVGKKLHSHDLREAAGIKNY
jgi:hypothetical protein